MSYLSQLEKKKLTNFSETLSPYPSEETMIYINIGGQNPVDLQEALDSIYFDDQREFNLVEVKKQPYIISALVVMKSKHSQPIKF